MSFSERLSQELTKNLSRCYVPKISESHLSRIVLFEVLNVSAEMDFKVTSLEIEDLIKNQGAVNITVNQDINISVTI